MAEYIVTKAEYPGLFKITPIVEMDTTDDKKALVKDNSKTETTSKSLLEGQKANLQERISEYEKAISEIDAKLAGIAEVK